MAVHNVGVREARRKQDDAAYVYVDVRSVPEFEMGHPAGAVNVPLLHRDERTGQMMPNREFVDVMRANFPPDAKLLIGCQVGGRSAQAAQILSASGFTDVSNVARRLRRRGRSMYRPRPAEGWVQASLPVETGRAEGHGYEDLHATLAEDGPVAE